MGHALHGGVWRRHVGGHASVRSHGHLVGGVMRLRVRELRRLGLGSRDERLGVQFQS